jgi:hypothetical protein
MAQDKDYRIMVNGTEHTTPNEIVTYKEVVEIAFPNQPNNPNTLYSVTFEHAHSKPHQGTLGPGGKVEVKKQGTEFDVTPTNRS